MAIRKNKKRIDPRYFLHETTHRDLNENEANTELNNKIAHRFTKWFAGGKPETNWASTRVTGGEKPVHRKNAPLAAKALAGDLRDGMFLGVVPEEHKEQYTELFNNLANALEQDPLLAHFRKLGKRGDWYAIATGNWDESMYKPPPYSDPDARRDYGWEDISDPGWKDQQ